MRVLKIIILQFILFILFLFSSKEGNIFAQSCTGYGICCSRYSFRCTVDGIYYPSDYCNDPANIGKVCTVQFVGTGRCQCTSSYTRTCNLGLGCVSNNCGAGDYLIEDFCNLTCSTSDQGCGALGCPPDTKRICTNCGSGWSCQCVADASCSTPAPTSSPPPSCTTTSPTNLSLTQVGFDSWNLTWTKGTGGAKQLVYVGEVKSEVEAGCPVGSSCLVSDTNVDVNSESYSLNLEDGIFYYLRVVNYLDASCSSSSSTLTDVSSCTLSPTSLTLEVGDTTTLSPILSSSSEVGSVTFVPDSGIVSVNPSSDSTHTYQTEVTGVSVGSGTISSSVLSPLGVTYCSDSSPVTVNPKGPWWQVKDGDIQTNGNLWSNVPSIPGVYLNIAGLGGFPGVTKYGGVSSMLSSKTSIKGWLANSSKMYVNGKKYNYNWFEKQITNDIPVTDISSLSVPGSFFETEGTLHNGYYWFKYDGSALGFDLTVTSDMNLADRRVILLVKEADLYIQGSINYNLGEGFFLTVVGKTPTDLKGNIFIDPSVGGNNPYDLQGYYISDATFHTGAGSSQLYLKGTVSAQAISLERDLGAALNSTTPSELFELSPSDIFTYPKELGRYRTHWKEVAP